MLKFFKGAGLALLLVLFIPREGAAEPVCGNGILEGEEWCDFGEKNNNNGPICNQNCMPARCGDGFVSKLLGEECEGEGPFCRNCKKTAVNPQLIENQQITNWDSGSATGSRGIIRGESGSATNFLRMPVPSPPPSGEQTFLQKAILPRIPAPSTPCRVGDMGGSKSAYSATLMGQCWTRTSNDDEFMKTIFPNPSFLFARITDYPALEGEFIVNATDCPNVEAVVNFKATHPGQNHGDLPWLWKGMNRENPASCTFTYSIPMSLVDGLINNLPAYTTGGLKRFPLKESEHENENYLAVILNGYNPVTLAQWSQRYYIRLREGSKKPGTWEWDESSWNSDFDPISK